MIRYFASHPTASNLLMILFLALGLLALPTLRRETFPDFTTDKLEIRVAYPGASAEDVEEAVCRRIEDAVDCVNHMEEITSIARENLGTVVVTMQEGANFQEFSDDIRTQIEGIDDFPELTEKPIIKALNQADHVVSLAVSGPMSVTDLKSYCERLKDKLELLDEVSQVTITGFSDRQIRIEVPADKLMMYGLSVTDIARAVERQSVDLPAGTIETRHRDVLVRFMDERHTPREFHSLVVVGGHSGAEVRLGDIATITDRFELDEEKILLNGQRAGLLKITKTKAEDTLVVHDAVKAFAEAERKRAPEGVQLVLTQNISSIVRDRLNLLIKNGWQGIILVFLTMWLFFSFRFSFWVAMGLPVSFLGTLFFMSQIGFTINMMTMLALLMALGLLMDDAIVLSENVASHLAKGKPVLDAVVDGVSEVKAGVIYSFLTTIIVFLPLCCLSGDVGKILRVIPLTLILVLSVSLVEAFLILPNHLHHSLSGRNGRRRKRRRVDEWLDWMRESVCGPIVDRAVEWRYLVAGISLMTILLAMGMWVGGILKFQPFPDLDGDVIEARLVLPQGTPLSVTEKSVQHIVDALDRVNSQLTPRQPGGRGIVRNVQVRYGQSRQDKETGPHIAVVSADLLTAEDRNARLDDVFDLWRQEVGALPDVLSLRFAELMLKPGGDPIDIRVRGSDLDELKRASGEVMEWFSQFDGVSDLADDLRPGKPEVRLRLEEGAMVMGLDAQTIATQLRAAYLGATAGEVQSQGEFCEIDVRLRPEDQDGLTDLESFRVSGAGGVQIPLAKATSSETGRGYAQICRHNGLRAVSVRGDVNPQVANTNEIIRKFRAELLPELERRYPEVRFAVEGEDKQAKETIFSMLHGLIFGLIGIFLLLSFQFRSYAEPIIVMTAIPMAFIGSIFGHLLLGIDLTLPGMLGFVSLAGVVVNDSILLVEFIKLRRRQGLSIPDAARSASRERFRAVMLTSLTTMAGLLPLLFEKSLQAQVLIPLAISIVFGLLASTILVLLVIPCLYCIIGDLGLAEKIAEPAHADTAPDAQLQPAG